MKNIFAFLNAFVEFFIEGARIYGLAEAGADFYRSAERGMLGDIERGAEEHLAD